MIEKPLQSSRRVCPGDTPKRQQRQRGKTNNSLETVAHSLTRLSVQCARQWLMTHKSPLRTGGTAGRHTLFFKMATASRYFPWNDGGMRFLLVPISTQPRSVRGRIRAMETLFFPWHWLTTIDVYDAHPKSVPPYVSPGETGQNELGAAHRGGHLFAAKRQDMTSISLKRRAGHLCRIISMKVMRAYTVGQS